MALINKYVTKYRAYKLPCIDGMDARYDVRDPARRGNARGNCSERHLIMGGRIVYIVHFDRAFV